jgi:hypothetical protein
MAALGKILADAGGGVAGGKQRGGAKQGGKGDGETVCFHLVTPSFDATNVGMFNIHFNRNSFRLRFVQILPMRQKSLKFL